MGSTYSIFQLKSGDDFHYHRFASLDTLEREGNKVEAKNYDKVYTGPLRENSDTNVMLDYLYAKFNRDHPADFKGHSLSVSDIVVIEKDGKSSAYYVDTFGFKEVPDFLAPELPDMSSSLNAEKSYRYMLLDRLRTDCEYYLGYGNRFAGRLWAGSEKGQIYAMKELWNSFSDKDKPEWLSYDKILEYEKAMVGGPEMSKPETKTPLSEQIRAADEKAAIQNADKTQVFLFEENRCGNRMGKPGDANNVYYASWFKFYSFGPDLIPREEGLSLNFKDPTTNKPVPGGNDISEVDVIEAFRKANPDRSVVMLSIEPFKGDLAVKMNQSLAKFREDGKALVVLPPLNAPTKQAEATR